MLYFPTNRPVRQLTILQNIIHFNDNQGNDIAISLPINCPDQQSSAIPLANRGVASARPKAATVQQCGSSPPQPHPPLSFPPSSFFLPRIFVSLSTSLSFDAQSPTTCGPTIFLYQFASTRFAFVSSFTACRVSVAEISRAPRHTETLIHNIPCLQASWIQTRVQVPLCHLPSHPGTAPLNPAL